jgi:hypothetical protein
MKTAYSLLISFFLIFSSSLWATNGELIPNSSAPIKEGDIVEAILRVWPVEQANESQFKKLEGQTLFQSLMLFKIISISTSENNADVTEVKALFVIRGQKLTQDQTIEVGTESVSVQWKGPAIQALPAKNKSFIILNQSTVGSFFWIIIGVIVFVLAALIFTFRKRLLELYKKGVSKSELTPAYFDQLFTTASSREDFERIYSLKQYWIPLLKIQTPAHNDFFKILNQHQYKKHWGSDELSETKTSFEMIRRSFSS